MHKILTVFYYLSCCLVSIDLLAYSKAFTQLIHSEPPTWHPKVSKHEVWELKNSLKSIERLLNQDYLEPQEKEHIVILAKYYIVGPLILCKSLHCSRCDLYKYQRREILKILLAHKQGQSILDILIKDAYLKENSDLLAELEKIKIDKAT